MTASSPALGRLKLRRMLVRGFKALADFDLRIPGDLLILIGANGSGKSSVLQALSFLQYIAQGDTQAFFRDRAWQPADLRSRVNVKGLGTANISYRLGFEAESGTKLYWRITLSILTGKLVAETINLKIANSGNLRNIVSFGSSKSVVGKLDVSGVVPNGSLASIIDLGKLDTQSAEVISALLSWGRGVFSLELLSPVEMRRGGRGSPSDIGPRGERLAGFLAALTPQQKASLVGRLSRFYPVKDIETTRKRAGWVDLRVAESFEGIGKTGAAHMSDGFLRLLGLAAIPEFSGASTVLLDEVEDGIEPHILPRFLKAVAADVDAQLILTSHSPFLVNAMDPDQVAFVARQPDGCTVASLFTDLAPLVEGLAYFGAGEMWVNTDMAAISEWVLGARPAAAHEEVALKSNEIIDFLEGR